MRSELASIGMSIAKTPTYPVWPCHVMCRFPFFVALTACHSHSIIVTDGHRDVITDGQTDVMLVA